MNHLPHSVCRVVSVDSTRGQQSSCHAACQLSCRRLPSAGQTLQHLLCANLPYKDMKNHQIRATLKYSFEIWHSAGCILMERETSFFKVYLVVSICSFRTADKKRKRHLVKGPGKVLISCCSFVLLRMTCADIKTQIIFCSVVQGGKKN